MDEEGYLLNTEEIERIKKEDEEIGKKGGLVVYLTEYFEPKVRAA